MVKPCHRTFLVFILAPILGACSAGAATPVDGAAASYTAAAMTVYAQATAAANTPSSLPTSSPVPQPSPTLMPTGTPFPEAILPVVVNSPACDDSAYISDVTIPDGTVVAPGESFTKTWNFRNTGTCDWTTSYAIAYLSGEAMSGSTTALSTSVSAGDPVDVSVAMVAPMTARTYTGYWRLQNAAGTFFGESVYVQIAVSGDTPTITPTPTATGIVSSYTSTPTSIPTNTPTPAGEPTSTTIPDTPTGTSAP